MKISLHFHHTIAAEFLYPCIGEYDSQHRLTYNPRGRYNTHITAFVATLAYIVMCSYIDGRQRVSERGNWLYCCPDNNWRSVANSTFYPSGIIRKMLPTLFVTPLNNIVHLRTG